jgi:hypothetical protein
MAVRQPDDAPRGHNRRLQGHLRQGAAVVVVGHFHAVLHDLGTAAFGRPLAAASVREQWCRRYRASVGALARQSVCHDARFAVWAVQEGPRMPAV